MRIKNNKILLIVFFCLSFLNTKGQIYELKLDTFRTDTLKISYLDNFNYDVIFIYLNGIEVSSNILYSNKVTASSGVSDLFYINQPDSSIKLDVIYFERNHQFSIEYNALWYKWSVESDRALYYKPIKKSFEITLTKNGLTTICISLDKIFESDIRKEIHLTRCPSRKGLILND